MNAISRTTIVALLLAGGSSAAAQDGLGSRRQPGEIFRDCPTCPQMVIVPAGSFMMGAPASEEGSEEAERPQHLVTIGEAFAVGIYEVTFAEWDACVRDGGCGGHGPDDEGWGRGSRPVMNVSWENALAYTEWLTVETGEAYRLLSEGEWEYAARAGTQTARWWGESESKQCEYANGLDRFAPCADGFDGTAPVGSFQPNAFGLYDVLGNVWEWTADCWNESYSGAPDDGGAWRLGDCSTRVLRGGSFGHFPRFLRSAYRSQPAAVRGYYLGFRVARTFER